ncbi:hypothetical protein GGF40_002341 [Coemansia sp. RSA 1286]|nr:hypothetical protein GGF40_002341 [Coemansia sp. RSA 1286]
MSPNKKTPNAQHPSSTPSGLGLGTNNSYTNGNPKTTTPTVRSVSNSSSTSAKGTAPCFHTTRPQFISSHIERCEACRLKYQRQAETVSRPYSPLAMRRTTGAPPRSGSRQSLGGATSGNNRPSSAASMVSLPSASTALSATHRPSSRASVASTKTLDTGRAQMGLGTANTRPKHNRSSSAGSPLVSDRANVRRAIALAGEKAVADSSLASSAACIPPLRADEPLSAISSSDGLPMSPTEAVAMRSRNRAARNQGKQHIGGHREAVGNNGAVRESRRGSSHSVHSHRRANNESPTKSIKNVQRMGGTKPLLPGNVDDGMLKAAGWDINHDSLMVAFEDAKRHDIEAAMEQKDTIISRLEAENRSLRQLSKRIQSGPASGPNSPATTNLFDPNSAVAKQRALEIILDEDRKALEMFDEFRKAYEDCEPSLRSNRVQYPGERPLSPPPGRQWASNTATPMRGSVDIADHDSRYSSLKVAQVRRAGEEFMSTPVGLHKTPRQMRATSTRRPTRVRAMRQAAPAGDSEMSEEAQDSDGLDEEDDHQDLRSCLQNASKFGTFLVQYINRQCLEYNTISEENKLMLVRLDELEKRNTQLDKLNRRLEEARDEQAAQSYEMSAQREVMGDKIDAAERNARRFMLDNDKLKQDLVASNERIEKLDEQVSRLQSELHKSRAAREHELSNMRHDYASLKEEKNVLSKSNDELRVELKGKLQRAGYKANVDEYLAERRKEAADAATLPTTPTAGSVRSPLSAHGSSEAVKAVDENKKIKELTQFFNRKLDKAKRLLQAERGEHNDTKRMLRAQQEETHRYEQIYGLLPDDASFDGVETIGDFMPLDGDDNDNGSSGTRNVAGISSNANGRSNGSGSISVTDTKGVIGSRRTGGRARSGSVLFADIDNSGVDELDDNEADDLFTGTADAASIVSNTAELLASPDDFQLSRTSSRSSMHNSVNDDDEDDEDADEAAIRRYEQRKLRLQQQQANMTTPRNRRTGGAKAASAIVSRRTKNGLLSIDVDPAGESLGDILGASGQWADPMSSRSKASMRGQLSARSIDPSGSLAAELGSGFDDSASIRSIDTSSNSVQRQRTRSSRSARGMPSPFGDAFAGTSGFGISYDESVSLAEQLASATPSIKSRAATIVFDRPEMVDASTSTDGLLEPVTAGIQASIPRPSADAAVATANTEKGAIMDTSVQAVAAFTDSQNTTDPLFGTNSLGIYAAPVTASCAVGTEISASAVSDQAIDYTPVTLHSGVQASAETSAMGMSTDPLIGVSDMSTSMDTVLHDQGCQAQAQLADQGMATERMYGMNDRGMAAIVSASDVGVSAGAGSVRESSVATVGPVLVDRSSATTGPGTASVGMSTASMDASDMNIGTDDSLLVGWLAPLIPQGVSAATVLAALHGRGEPVYKLFQRQVADAARSDAFAEYERQAALAAEKAAEQAAALVKVCVDKCVYSEVTTAEQSIQAEPKRSIKAVQAGAVSVSSVGVDVCMVPSVADIGVGTGGKPVSRWIEPFDPVEKVAKQVSAVALTAERSTSQGIEYSCVSVGPTSVSQHVSVDATASCSDCSTTMGVKWTDAAVGPVVSHSEQAVDAAAGKCVSVSISTATETADKATTNAMHSSCRYIEAGIAKTAAVGTETESAAVTDKSEGPVHSMSERGTDAATDETPTVPDVAIVEAGIQTKPSVADANIATVGTPLSLSSASVNDVRSIEELAAPATLRSVSVATDAAAASTAVAAIATDASFVSAVERADVGVETEPMLTPTITPAYVDSSASSVNRPAVPNYPPPPVPGSVAISRPASLVDSATDLHAQVSRKSSVPDMPAMSAAEETAGCGESDGEDYGYIMVSPRTNVQHIAVSAISSSRNSSIGGSSVSIRGKRLALALFDRSTASQDDLSRSASDREAVRDTGDIKRRGLDQDAAMSSEHLDEDDDDVDDDERGDVSSMHDRTVASGTTGGGISTFAYSDALVGTEKRESMSVGVEASDMQMQQYIARQPEPLIVQAIARTMVGTFMWKYTTTHFPNGSNARERRHKRYFWIHPYAKMLNWSKQPPSGGTSLTRSTRESGSRSVYMRSIRIVPDNGPASGSGDANGGTEPAYCIIVRTDHREIKIKAIAQADHDLWYLAMSYLQSRRIITSTTYPTVSTGTHGTAGHPGGDYFSDNSMRSRATSSASVDENQRIIMDADRRHRTGTGDHSRSRSRSRSRPRGSIVSHTISGAGHGHPPLPPAPSHLPSAPHTLSSGYGGGFGGRAAVVPTPPAVPPRPQYSMASHQVVHRNSTTDVTPERVHSLQSTPRSLRPVSMMPSTTPLSNDGHHSKRLSIGLFRRSGGSTASLFRNGSQMSVDSAHLSSPPMHPVGAGYDDASAHMPQSIAATMMGRQHSSSIATNSNSAVSAASSGSSNSVRKMFSGSFLRALRSRESVNDPNI